MSPRRQKFAQKLLAVMVLFALIFPQTASAQMITSSPIMEALQAISNAATQVWRFIKPIVLNVATVAVVNVGQQLARDSAESIAQWVATGGTGKNPLMYMKGPSDYAKDAKNQALGEAIGDLSQRLGLGDMLCKPAFPGFGTELQLGLSGFGLEIGTGSTTGGHIQPTCDYQKVMQNWESMAASLEPQEFMKRYNKALDSGQSEIGLLLASQMNVFGSMSQAEIAANMERTQTQSARAVVDPISKKTVKAPGLVQYEAESVTVRAADEKQQAVMTGLLASGAEAIPSIFANTLLNSLSKKLLAKLRQGKDVFAPDKKSVNLADVFGAGSGSGAQNFISDSRVVDIQGGDLDLLTQFETCPSQFAGVDNCVVDSAFSNILRNTKSGKVSTVQQALQENKLHGDYELIPPSNNAVNEDANCFRTAYCYSNLVKLRRARVIPIGWEIAAANAGVKGKTTLKDVVAGFNDCKRTCSIIPTGTTETVCKSNADCLPVYKANGVEIEIPSKGVCEAQRDSDHPYCHLIDPNWILKMPDTMCRAMVYGASLESSLAPTRQQECVDQPSCLSEDVSGQCQGGFGYCLREKNVWRMEADTCPEQFAGCRTFTNKNYGSISMLESTVDSEICSEKNTGCLGYYSEYMDLGSFNPDKSKKIYLNGKTASCEAKYAGCTEVQTADTAATNYLRLPPVSLNCMGSIDDQEACNQYATICTADEVGCDIFTPANDEPAIPGIAQMAVKNAAGTVVAWNNECASECVGYSLYYQKPTTLEPKGASKPLAFIPKTATQCTSDQVGCDKFLNIDEATKGGGSTAYYSDAARCARPQDKSHATFYTWEGSDTTGYQLRTFELVTDGDKLKLDKDYQPGEICNKDIYKERKNNPFYSADCREFFDKTGVPTYMMLSHTLPSTAECVLTRREGVTAENCTLSGGTFANNFCEQTVWPAKSPVCKAEMVGCRAFSGSAAANSRAILSDAIDAGNTWSGGAISNEGVTVDDSVWKVLAGTAETSHDLVLQESKTYRVIFWVKGQGAVDVKLSDGAGTTVVLNASPIKLSVEWRRFEVSSAPLAKAATAGKLIFANNDKNGVMFLDNILVREETDAVYVVKNSWKTPLTCDPDPVDNVPGPALNCSEYSKGVATGTPAENPKVYLSGFQNICRERSAGCAKFVNTYNTSDISAKVVATNQPDPDTSIPETSIIIPADEYIYVAAAGNAVCPADQRGCSALGTDLSGTMETVYKINDPDTYATTACFQEEDRCETFAMDSQQRYFKYPEEARQCEYRENVSVANKQTASGWFKKGTDKPCYANLIMGGNFYGIFKNSDPEFAKADSGGQAGLCAADMNACTAFVDHADVAKEFPAGHPYYLLNNKKLDVTSCGGKVSLKDGCVLLEDTTRSQENHFATLLTYCKSDPFSDPQCAALLKSNAALVPTEDQRSDGEAVGPVNAEIFKGVDKASALMDCRNFQLEGITAKSSCKEKLDTLKGMDAFKAYAGNLECPVLGDNKDLAAIDAWVLDIGRVVCAKYADANTIVKVSRDRACSEWLACRSNSSVLDKTTGKYREVCNQLGVCNQYSFDPNNVGNCGNWVATDYAKQGSDLQTPLSTDKYLRRNVGWFGAEYSGYSLWNKFQPQQVNVFSVDSQKKQLLGVSFTSAESLCAVKKDGTACIADIYGSVASGKNVPNASVVKEFPDASSYEGLCYQKKCWYPVDGFTKEQPSEAAIGQLYTDLTCRAYPEADSPYPTSIVDHYNEFGQGAQKAPAFKGANVCEKNVSILLRRTDMKGYWGNPIAFADSIGQPPEVTANESCDCSYSRNLYGESEAPAFFATNASAPAGICDGGWYVIGAKYNKAGGAAKGTEISKKGISCSADFDCIDERVKDVAEKKASASATTAIPSGEDGRCLLKKSATFNTGWKGYCLENDLRTRVSNSNEYSCLTWLPLDVGDKDIFNTYFSASFQPGKNGEGMYYCTQSEGNLNDAGGSTVEAVLETRTNRPTELSLVLLGKDNYTGVDQSIKFWDGGTNDATVFYVDEKTKNLKSRYSGGIPKSDIDYIELVAADKNPFFPAGYKMIVAEDGLVRFYVNQLWVTAMANNEAGVDSCPQAGFTGGADLSTNFKAWNLLDPDAVDNLNGKSTNKERLTDLSLLARCTKDKQNVLNCPGGYFNNEGKGTKEDVAKYFSCSTGEKGTPAGYSGEAQYYKFTQSPEKARELAVTGAVLYPGSLNAPLQYADDDVMSSNKVGGTPVFDQKGFTSSWYVRVDNQLNNADQFGVGPNMMWKDIIVRKLHSTSEENNVLANYKEGILCNMGGEDWRRGYELRFLFDKKKNLTRIDAAYCDGSGNSKTDWYIGWKIKIHLRDRCTQVIKTNIAAADDIDLKRSYAYTNNLWQPQNNSGAYKKLADDPLAIYSGKNKALVDFTALHAPYGSFQSTNDPDKNPSTISMQLWFATSTMPALHQNMLVGAFSYGCSPGNCLLSQPEKIPFKSTEVAAKTLISNNLFAGWPGYFTQKNDDDFWSYSAENGYDQRDAALAMHRPVVAAFDPSQCSPPGSGKCRLAGIDKMTINGFYKDNVAIVGKGSVTANLQFYGWADTDHMPLRRVLVDWGDKTKDGNTIGMYRNHKAVCSTNDTPAAHCHTWSYFGSNITCQSDADCKSLLQPDGKVNGDGICHKDAASLLWSFGDWNGGGQSAGACQEGYFQFMHAYTWTEGCEGGIKIDSVTQTDIDQYKLTGVGKDESICIFKPKVQLMDNWDICNGVKVDGVTPWGYINDAVGEGCGTDVKEAYTPFQGYIVVKE